MSEIFKQQPNKANEFDGGGTDDVAGVDSLRSHLQGNVTSSTVKTPVQEDFQMPQAMTEAQAMYMNARKLMNQPKDQPQEQPFNPEINQNKFKPKDKFSEFKDPLFEQVMSSLTLKSGRFDEVELPSKGKFYLKGEGPSNGLLHMRPMTGAEEQILTTPRYAKKNQTLNMIFKECIGEQINPEMLLSVDRTYLLIYLRGISYSRLYDVEIKCPDCSKSFQHQIDIGGLNVDYCPDDFGPSDLEDTLPNSGLKVKYRLSIGKDESGIQEHRDYMVKNWGADAPDDSTIYRAALMIEELGGVTNKTMIQQLVTRLPIGDMAYLRELLNEPPFGVDTKVGIICPHCSNEFEINMPMDLSFFFPKPNLQKKKRQRA